MDENHLKDLDKQLDARLGLLNKRLQVSSNSNNCWKFSNQIFSYVSSGRFRMFFFQISDYIVEFRVL